LDARRISGSDCLSECEFLIRPERILGGLEHFACGAGRLAASGRVLWANPALPPLPSWSEAVSNSFFECRSARAPESLSQADPSGLRLTGLLKKT
jgi:hypothetical protein